MSYIEKCQMEAKLQIDTLKYRAGGIKAAMKQISLESGIPFGTLNRWYYPEKFPHPKNGVGFGYLRKKPEKLPVPENCLTLSPAPGRWIQIGKYEKDGGQVIVFMEGKYRKNKDGKDVPSKYFIHRIDIPIDKIQDLMDTMQKVIEGPAPPPEPPPKVKPHHLGEPQIVDIEEIIFDREWESLREANRRKLFGKIEPIK